MEDDNVTPLEDGDHPLLSRADVGCVQDILGVVLVELDDQELVSYLVNHPVATRQALRDFLRNTKIELQQHDEQNAGADATSTLGVEPVLEKLGPPRTMLQLVARPFDPWVVISPPGDLASSTFFIWLKKEGLEKSTQEDLVLYAKERQVERLLAGGDVTGRSGVYSFTKAVRKDDGLVLYKKLYIDMVSQRDRYLAKTKRRV